MAARRGAWETSAYCHSNIVGTKGYTRWKSQDHEKPWSVDPGRSRKLEKCHCHVRDGSSGIVLRAEVKETSRQHPEVFTVDDAGEFDTQSETEMEFGQD